MRRADAVGVKGERTMRRTKIAVICFALAVSVLAMGSASAQAEGCEANKICVYSGINYNVIQPLIYCSGAGATGTFGASATNRCGNKTDWLRYNGSVIACMNPGGNRPNPGIFNEVYVAYEYGAFC